VLQEMIHLAVGQGASLDGSGLRGWGSRFRFKGSGSWVEGLGLRAQAFGQTFGARRLAPKG
jgi:hypothetical protein